MKILQILRKRISFIRSKRFYSQFIRKGDLCFDIGANIGERSALFLALGARVIAVEPQTRCMASLNELKRKYGERIVILKAAISDKAGTAELNLGNVSETSTLSGKFMAEFGKHGVLTWNETEIVELRTLEDLITEFGIPRYCKIDTEGFEWNVISPLRMKIPYIEFEFTPVFKEEAIACIHHLSGLASVQFNFTRYEQPSLVLPEWVNAQEMKMVLAKVDPKIIHGNIFVRIDQNAGN